jgi:hypothetical protein
MNNAKRWFKLIKYYKQRQDGSGVLRTKFQDQSGNNIINENADTITIGASGDTITIPAGATLSNLGTASGFG